MIGRTFHTAGGVTDVLHFSWSMPAPTSGATLRGVDAGRDVQAANLSSVGRERDHLECRSFNLVSAFTSISMARKHNVGALEVVATLFAVSRGCRHGPPEGTRAHISGTKTMAASTRRATPVQGNLNVSVSRGRSVQLRVRLKTSACPSEPIGRR